MAAAIKILKFMLPIPVVHYCVNVGNQDLPHLQLLQATGDIELTIVIGVGNIVNFLPICGVSFGKNRKVV